MFFNRRHGGVNAMATKFSKRILQASIAPGVAELKCPDIRYMSMVCKSWIAVHFLNTALTGQFQAPTNAYVYNHLRRVRATFYAYEHARELTLKFIENPHLGAHTYAFALFHWETFLGQAWHSLKLLQTGFKVELFKTGDNSLLERLNRLYNQMKHVESCIENGQMIPGASVPVWLENDGLVSVDKKMTYADCAEVLELLAK